MSRIAVAATLAALAFGCSKKTDSNQQSSAMPGDLKTVPTDPSPQPTGEGAKGGDADARYRLKPEEGQLAVQAPADAKAGAETTASIVVTPGPEYKVNTEFPTKLTLETPAGVTITKAEFKAGGANKEKGDADVFDESKLTFTVKLTPAAAGAHTIKGSFKFAVCDKAGSTCLAKKEPIAIQVAAK